MDEQAWRIEGVANSGRVVDADRAPVATGAAVPQRRAAGGAFPAGDGRDLLCLANRVPVEGSAVRVRIGQYPSPAIPAVGQAWRVSRAVAERVDGIR